MSSRRFLDRLFEGCGTGLVEFRAVPSGRRVWTQLGRWSDAGSFVSAAVNAGENVFVGAATRKDATNGTAENLRELAQIVVDIDASPDEVRRRFDGFPF